MDWGKLEEGFAAEQERTQKEFETLFGTKEPSKEKSETLTTIDLRKALVKIIAKQIGEAAFSTLVWALIPGGMVAKLAGSAALMFVEDVVKKRGKIEKRVVLKFRSVADGVAVFAFLKKSLPKLATKLLKKSIGPQGEMIITISGIAVGSLVYLAQNINVKNN